MSNNVSIHFKCQDRMYSLMLKTSAEEVTLSMIEARIYKKLGLNESKVKLHLSYYPLLVGCEEPLTISDDEDVCVYLMSIDKENRRCILFVKVIIISDLSEQLSRAGGSSSFGKNYDEWHSHDGEIRANDITLYVEKEQTKEHEEATVDDDTIEDGNAAIVDDDTIEDGNASHDEGLDNGMYLEISDNYVENQSVVEASQGSQGIDPWEDGLGLSLRQEFPSRKALQEVVDRAAFVNSYGFVIKKSDPDRLVLKCSKESCKWGLRAARIRNTVIFSIRRYTKMHTCSRASQSRTSSNIKRHGTPQLVAALLHEDYPGQMETPPPRCIIDLVKTKLGVTVSYSTALRGKNLAVSELRGSPEESYKVLYCYLHMLEKVNDGTITRVKLDEKEKFKYLFIALGACIEGFQVMRKVIIVDATFLKNGYGGVLIFASAQDPNRHHYPIAFGVLDGEKDASWTWFMEMLKTVIPDSSELVFMSDRNASLISAIGNVYPQAHHGFCVWHLSQNVKGHASNVNKDVVAWRCM